MTNIMDMMDKMVLVTWKNFDGSIEAQWEGKVFDINVENEVLWVERFENGESYDYYDVSLKNPCVSVVEIQEIEEVVARDKEVHMTVKEAKKDFMHKIRYEDEVEVKVKICSTIDSFINADVWDIEINAYVDEDYLEGTTVETFYDEESAVKRAKAILTSVKGWFKYSDDVVVDTKVEVYYV